MSEEHEQPTEIRTIPITVDKSHLVTLGEKLYTEKTSLVRELVNNAFDADATEVCVDIAPDRLTVRDNGSGMDEDGLRRYFTIGGSQKRNESSSPKFGRKRIGEFGIGKFAALSVSNVFEIETWRGAYHARLVFDKDHWSKKETWELAVEPLPPHASETSGTMITLRNPSVTFAPGKVRRYLAERTPIHAPHFIVRLNGEVVTDDLLPGERIPIGAETPYGLIRGTIILLPPERAAPVPGIAVRVKGVLIRRDTFGLETSRKIGMNRVSGFVDADFLPVTSSRDDFQRDTPEYLLFYELMRKEMNRVLGRIRDEADRKVDLQSSRVLKDALLKIGRAMRKRRDLFPSAQVPMGDATTPDKQEGGGYEIGKATFVESRKELDPEVLERLKQTRNAKGRKGAPHTILGKKSVIRNLRIANLDIAVRVEHLGNDDASMRSGGVIYINSDHPLYRLYQKQDDLLALHITRLITKELALHAGIMDAAQAFALQDELLTNALK